MLHLSELATRKGLEFQQPTLEIEQYNLPQQEVSNPTLGINPSEHSTRISSAYANGIKIDLVNIGKEEDKSNNTSSYESKSKIKCTEKNLNEDSRLLNTELEKLNQALREKRNYSSRLSLNYDYKNPKKYDIPLFGAVTANGETITVDIFDRNAQLLQSIESLSNSQIY